MTKTMGSFLEKMDQSIQEKMRGITKYGKKIVSLKRPKRRKEKK